MTRALILVGHGSHLNADSSAPVYAHAAAIRASGAFDEVHEAFWKEEPPLTSVLHLSDADEVLIVPLFLSEGYFTREVLPREIGLSSQEMRRGHQTVRYLSPVGTHPAMTTMILRRADRVIGRDPERRKRAVLAVIGHGTERNATSADTVYDLVERLRGRGEFRAVVSGFLDEAPFIADVLAGLDAEEIVLVPFFVAEGWHTRETIPEELGLTGEVTTRARQTIWYTPPVGTLPEMVDVILEMTGEGSAGAPPAEVPLPGDTAPTALNRGAGPGGELGQGSPRDALFARLDASDRGARFMDVLIEPVAGGVFSARHLDDRGAAPSELESHTDPEDARDIARYRADGSYRAMRSTRDLRRGWVFPRLSTDGLWRVLSLLYPAALGDWFRASRREPVPNHFRSWAERQTAMYAEVRDLAPEGVGKVTEDLCAACHRTRLWRDELGPIGEVSPLPIFRSSRSDGFIVPCLEPCTMFATGAREIIKEQRKEAGSEG